MGACIYQTWAFYTYIGYAKMTAITIKYLGEPKALDHLEEAI